MAHVIGMDVNINFDYCFKFNILNKSWNFVLHRYQLRYHVKCLIYYMLLL